MIEEELGRDEIRLLAPGKRKCPVCADRHRAWEPHNRNSLYYQLRFRRENGRDPTWEDAMADLSQLMRAYWLGILEKKRRENQRKDGSA